MMIKYFIMKSLDFSNKPNNYDQKLQAKNNLLLQTVPEISDMSKAEAELLHQYFHHLDPKYSKI